MSLRGNILIKMQQPTEQPVQLNGNILHSAPSSASQPETGHAGALREGHKYRSVYGFCRQLKGLLGNGKASVTIDGRAPDALRVAQIEDFPRGYPQYAALVGSHASFYVCRRFLRAHARMLLLKQDEVSRLESQLDIVDSQEERALFLGNSRRDQNPERREILVKLDAALLSYDKLLDRTHRILAYEEPRKTDVKNLRNWVENTSSLAEDETAYLSHTEDLLTILSPRDDALARLVPLLEKIMRGLRRVFRKPQCDISRDPNISILPLSRLQRLTRSLIAWLVVVFLLVPIVILNALASTGLRMAVIVIASAVLITALSNLTNAKTVEVFVAGAT